MTCFSPQSVSLNRSLYSNSSSCNERSDRALVFFLMTFLELAFFTTIISPNLMKTLQQKILCKEWNIKRILNRLEVMTVRIILITTEGMRVVENPNSDRIFPRETNI